MTINWLELRLLETLVSHLRSNLLQHWHCCWWDTRHCGKKGVVAGCEHQIHDVKNICI